MGKGDTQKYREIVNLWTTIGAIVFIAVGFFILYFVRVNTTLFWREIGTLLVVTGAVTFVTQQLARRAFLDEILNQVGLSKELVSPLAGRLKELYFDDVIVLKQGLSEPERRELIARALGHHFLHAGNHYAASKGAYSWDKYQERQAEIFAAYLLIPDVESDKAFELAEGHNVTEKFAEFRLKLAEHYGGVPYLVEIEAAPNSWFD